MCVSCTFNNVTNLTLILGLAAIFCSPAILSAAGGGKAKHSPSIATLRRYAQAVGCRLEIKLVPMGRTT